MASCHLFQLHPSFFLLSQSLHLSPSEEVFPERGSYGRSQKLWNWQVWGCASFLKQGMTREYVCYPQTLSPGDEPPGGLWLLGHSLCTGCPQSFKVPETVPEVVFCLSPPDPDETTNPVSAELL